MDNTICSQLESLLKAQGIATNDESAIDVVYGGAFSIRDYYMESGNPRLMRGASQLLIDAAAEAARHVQALQNGLYFACGAESFFVVLPGEGAAAATAFERLFREHTVTAQAAAVSMQTTVGALRDAKQFGLLWGELNAAFWARRMLLFFPIDAPSGHTRCTRCNFREPIDDIPATDLRLCESCGKKYETGGKIRNQYQRACVAYGMSARIKGADTFQGGQDTEDLSDGNADIALLYADINNLGGIGKDLQGGAERRKAFTEAVSNAVRNALYSAVLRGLQATTNHHFEIIAAGGDDICVMVPGEIGLLVGTLLLEQFDKEWMKNGQGFPTLTISAGIAVGHYSTPLVYMREAAEQLLSIAKGKAHVAGQGCLDILSLNSDGQWATRIQDKLRKDLRYQEEDKTANRTLRPFSAGEARRMLGWLAQSRDRVPISTIYNIADALMRMGIEEGNLWFRYLLSRQTEKEDKSENGLKILTESIAADCAMYYAADDTLWSPWRDLAELRNQKTDRGE
ncbi:MAG: hypothetical protein LBU45_06130 [Azoarcus sp.]|jgi:GGDEF domain-containing protein|nr:hypothetical protein [Azoarcus sp.]